MQICSNYQLGRCGSCSLMAEGHGAADIKRQRLVEQLRSYPKCEIDTIVCPSEAFPSRAKAKIQISGSAAEPILGLIDNSFKGISLMDCPLHLPVINRALVQLKELITEQALHPYQILERQGELKAIHLVTNSSQTELIIRFIMRSRSMEKRLARSLADLRQRIPECRVVSLNIQPIPHAIFEGEEEIIFSEEEVISESYCGRVVYIGPRSFMQVTPEVAAKLYDAAGAMVDTVSGVIDLFCGSGGFSFFLAPKAKWLLGVELSQGAVDCAIKGASANGFGNATFIAEDVSKFLTGYDGDSPEVIMINPPRRGVEQAVIELIKKMAPRKVIYSSCNPATLIRDLQLFAPQYRPTSAKPFDMFPLSDHLEVLVGLERAVP